MAQLVVNVNNLTKEFSGRQAVIGCDISVEKGAVYGLLGRNGAGKTTIFKLLLGLLKPTSGSARILGYDIRKDRDRILRHTGNLIETPVFYEHLSVRENLQIHLAYMGMEETDPEPALQRMGLSGISEQPVGELSLGNRQRLAIARAMVHMPEVLILDEPANGLDPVGIRDMRRLFRELKERGVTILLSSHNLYEIIQTADSIGIIVNGKMAMEATAENIRREHPGIWRIFSYQ